MIDGICQLCQQLMIVLECIAMVDRSESDVGSKTPWLRNSIITSLFAIAAAVFGAFVSGWLADVSKQRELELAATRRAIDSVENMTRLIFQRDVHAGLIASSIKRNANFSEIAERKKHYDEAYVDYNANIQSNLFNIRDIFHTVDYTVYENILRYPIRILLMAEDQCITNAYDAAAKADEERVSNPAKRSDFSKAVTMLQHCLKDKSDTDISFAAIHQKLIICEYVYSEDLFRVVASPEGISKHIAPNESVIREKCNMPIDANQMPQFQATNNL